MGQVELAMVDGVVEGETRVLKPANENPWYVLMTLYGEQDGEEIDWELHAKNRAAWNAWACQGMSEEDRKKAAESSRVTLQELSAWPQLKVEVGRRYEAEMLKRNGEDFDYLGLPTTTDVVDISNVEFVSHFVMCNTVFSGLLQSEHAAFSSHASFRSATFMGDADFYYGKFGEYTTFNLATFSAEANFLCTVFKATAHFSSATFGGTAEFHVAEFIGNASFADTTFSGEASFIDVTFNQETEFHFAKFATLARFGSAKFQQHAWFVSCIFMELADFSHTEFGSAKEDKWAGFGNCQFEKNTNFHNATFHSRYPDFSGTILHDKTTFTDNPANWPQGAQSDPAKAKASCAVIRHNLGKQGLPEAEHFFFRREMGFAGQIGGFWERLPYRLFGVFSDYGYSIARPAISLFWVWFVPTLIFAAFRVTGMFWDDLTELLWSASLSFSNLFPVFGFHRVWFDPVKLAALAPWLQTLAGAQTVVSLPLLFFLGLGLRTRFRMR